MRDRHPPPPAQDIGRRTLRSPSPQPLRSPLSEKPSFPFPTLSQHVKGSPPGVQRRAGASPPHRGPHQGRRQHSWHHCLLDRQCSSHSIEKEGRRPPTTTKALLATVSEDTTRYLRPTQLEFGEAIVHAQKMKAPETWTWRMPSSRSCVCAPERKGMSDPRKNASFSGRRLRSVLLVLEGSRLESKRVSEGLAVHPRKPLVPSCEERVRRTLQEGTM